MKQLFFLTGNYDSQVKSEEVPGKAESYGDLTELMIIIGKSLINDEAREKLSIDIPRLKEELILWKYYRKGDIRCFLLRQENPEESRPVSTGIISLLPLMIGNSDYPTLEQEITAFCYNTNQNGNDLVLFLLMGKLVDMLIHKPYPRDESLINGLKEYLIHLNYNRVFKNISQDNRIEKIPFEKSKIQWIMDLDRVAQANMPKKKKSESHSNILFIQGVHIYWKFGKEAYGFEEVENFEVSREAKILSLLLKDMENRKNIIGTSSDTKSLSDFQGMDFLREMDRYFNRLKKFEIRKNPFNEQKFKSQNFTDTKELFSMRKDDTGTHPILKGFKIQRKEIDQGILYLGVKTKSGYYELKKPSAQG